MSTNWGFGKVSVFKSAGQDSADQLPPEPDNMPSGLLAGLITVLIFLLIGVGIGSQQLLWKAGEAHRVAVAAQPQSEELGELQATDNAVLESYDAIDQSKGIYRIPVRQAIELYVKTQGQK